MDRQLRGQGPVRLAVVQLPALDQADDGPVHLHDGHVVDPSSLAERLSEQIDVRLAYQIRGIRETKARGHLLTHAHQTAVTILEVDAVCLVLHEGPEEKLIAPGIELRRSRICHAHHPWRASRPTTLGLAAGCSSGGSTAQTMLPHGRSRDDGPFCSNGTRHDGRPASPLARRLEIERAPISRPGRCQRAARPAPTSDRAGPACACRPPVRAEPAPCRHPAPQPSPRTRPRR